MRRLNLGKFQHIIDTCTTEDKELGVYLQQDGFLDKRINPSKDLASDRPINQNILG